MDDAVKTLKDAGVIWCDKLDDAIAKVVALSKGGE
jgi:hypothetical protein